MFFVCFGKMTFGYYFSFCVTRLSIGWNELEPNGYNFFFNGYFGYKLKGNGVSLGDQICLNVAIFCYKCQIIITVLAIANSHKGKSKLPSTKTWRLGI